MSSRTAPRSASAPTSARPGLDHQPGEAGAAWGPLAKAAGVSAALIMHHFGSRDRLIAAVDEAALREFGDAYRRPGEGLPGEGRRLLQARAEQTRG